MWPDARCFGTGHRLQKNSVALVKQSRSRIGCLSVGEAQPQRMGPHVPIHASHIHASHAVGW